jgi:uncharacterized protein
MYSMACSLLVWPRSDTGAREILGDVNLPLVSGLLLGSIPGVWLGSFITSRLPEGTLRPAIAVLLFVTGVKLV